MKFAEHLSAHITPEWRKQYILYEDLKVLLYTAVEEAPSYENVDSRDVSRYFAKFDEQFFHECDKELAKINTFYSEKFAEATRRFSTLKSELNDHDRQAVTAGADGIRKRKTLQFITLDRETHKKVKRQTRKLHDLKLAFSEFYLSLILLQNYQTLNFTGFRKILKKHDKLLGKDNGAKWRMEHVESAIFYTNKEIDKLIPETEGLFTSDLERGNRQKAMKRLRVPPLGDRHSPWTTYKLGLFSGAFIVMIVAIVLSAMFFSENKDNWKIIVRLYRGPFLLILDVFLLGINVYGWRSSGVNHVLIFELDPRNHLNEQHLMEIAAIFGVLWAISLLSFLHSNSLNIPAYANPLALVIIMLIYLLNPTKTLYHQSRFWLMRILLRVAGAPFFHVGFADFWLADQLNSLVPGLLDLQYLICFYINNVNWVVNKDTGICYGRMTLYIRPLIACLPAWFRFAQCLRRYRDSREAFPHLVNAGKYSTTFFVVILSTAYNFVDESDESHTPFFYLWLIATVVSSSYAFMWDIKMDWGFFDKNAGENKFLREEIVYSSKGYYYFAVIEDFILRFVWTCSVSFTELGLLHGEIILTIFAPLEVFRRFVWNYFRLENEHLNNCGNFRAVRDISVAPMDASDQALILKMMDEEDGVDNRKVDKKTGRLKRTETKVVFENLKLNSALSSDLGALSE